MQYWSKIDGVGLDIDYRFIQGYCYFGGYAYTNTKYIVSTQTAGIYFQGFIKSVVEFLQDT